MIPMPPTRGHDLKPRLAVWAGLGVGDAPHTGARLETLYEADLTIRWLDAPHTGARLETSRDRRR